MSAKTCRQDTPLSCWHVLWTKTSLVIQDVFARHVDKTSASQDTPSTRHSLPKSTPPRHQKCTPRHLYLSTRHPLNYVLRGCLVNRCLANMSCQYWKGVLYYRVSCQHVLWHKILTVLYAHLANTSCEHILWIFIECILIYFWCLANTSCTNVLLTYLVNFYYISCDPIITVLYAYLVYIYCK